MIEKARSNSIINYYGNILWIISRRFNRASFQIQSYSDAAHDPQNAALFALHVFYKSQNIISIEPSSSVFTFLANTENTDNGGYTF